MVSFFGFGQSAEIAIQLKNEETQRTTRIRVDDGQYETFYLFYDGENVEGEVLINLKKPGQKLEHQGIRIDFIGQIEVYYDRGNQHDFLYQTNELAKAGDLYQNTKYEFCFANASKPYETYMGSNVKLRYFLRVTVMRRLTDIVHEMEIAVHTLATYPDNDASIKMEVGIEDCLHIEFEYNKSRYHLKDVIVGKIYFLLTFLAGYDLTPTMRDVAKRFSVRYFLNLVLIDEEDRRYFKQQEIILWRRLEKPFRQPIQQHFQQSQGPIVRSSIISPPSSPLPTNSSVEELIGNKQQNEE
uniref:Vacuolar protein sorting-associated protein 26 n=1 Tax=Meloidogyne hapla TaxID=6305 RepID=A0A1I8BZP7_MELHA